MSMTNYRRVLTIKFKQLLNEKHKCLKINFLNYIYKNNITNHEKQPNLIIILSVGDFIPYAQIKVYVSSGGSDNNPGTLAKPFKTPERAVQEIEKANGKALIIYLRKGIYYLQKPIVLDNKNLKTKSLLISSYPGEQAL
jgi:hypothetical protein